MKKEIRELKNGLVQCTVADERWYWKPIVDPKKQIAFGKWVPSVTYITSFYPKGKFFENFLKAKGDESEQIKLLAGEKGSKIHQAIADIIGGKEVGMDYKYINPTTENEEELRPDEYEAIQSFVDWAKEVKPITIAHDVVVFSDKYDYAGTVDYICMIGECPYIVDFKSGSGFYPKDELQVSAYRQAVIENKLEFMEGICLDNLKLLILQVGYSRNKKKFKATEIEDQFSLFLDVKNIWTKECANIEPKKYEWKEKLFVKIPLYGDQSGKK